MGLTNNNHVIMHVDNKGARYFQSSCTLDSRLKGYFDLREAWVQELRDKSQVSVEKVTGKDNFADLLTKPLKPSRFNTLLRIAQGSRVDPKGVKVKGPQEDQDPGQDP